eukprot:m.133291 g.133291  ORF g.133291 m.133291 type:complete len:217 (+) comp15947_c0_seq7:42-692(+)
MEDSVLETALALFAVDDSASIQELESLWKDACEHYNASSAAHVSETHLPPLISAATKPQEASDSHRQAAKRPSSRRGAPNGKADADGSDDDVAPPRRRNRRHSVLDDEEEEDEVPRRQRSARSRQTAKKAEPKWVGDEQEAEESDGGDSEVDGGASSTDDEDSDYDGEAMSQESDVSEEQRDWQPEADVSDMDDNDDSAPSGAATKTRSRRRPHPS